MGIGGLYCCPKCISKEAESALKTSINLNNPIINIPEDETKNNVDEMVENINDNNYEDNGHNPNEKNNIKFSEKIDNQEEEKINHTTKIKTTLSNKDNNEDINGQENFGDKSQSHSELINSSTITSGIIQKGLQNEGVNEFEPKKSTNQFTVK